MSLYDLSSRIDNLERKLSNKLERYEIDQCTMDLRTLKNEIDSLKSEIICLQNEINDVKYQLSNHLIFSRNQ